MLREAFGESRLAAMMISAVLADPRMLIEIEVTALCGRCRPLRKLLMLRSSRLPRPSDGIRLRPSERVAHFSNERVETIRQFAGGQSDGTSRPAVTLRLHRSEPQQSVTENGETRFFVRIGQPHFRHEGDGSFTPLEPTFHDLDAYRATADRALTRFAKGGSFVAEG